MSGINDSFPSTVGMSDSEVEARQLASRPATVTPRSCECPWCVSGPRRTADLLVYGQDLEVQA